MKKLTIAILMLFSSYSLASAEIGVNIGATASTGVFMATATETDSGTHGTTSGHDENNTEDGYLPAAFLSVFIEKTLGDRFMIGASYVPDAIESETATATRFERTGRANNAGSSVTQSMQVDFTDLSTLYAGVKVTDNAYIKVGAMTVDMVTNESLGTGSTYGNASMNGTVIGVGYDNSMDNGLFVRVEANYMQFDGVSLTSSSGSQKMTVDHLDGVSAAVSLAGAKPSVKTLALTEAEARCEASASAQLYHWLASSASGLGVGPHAPCLLTKWFHPAKSHRNH
jgi:hypothetical protein